MQLEFIRSGRSVENGYIESFNGRRRDEGLNVEVFFALADLHEKLERWRQDYSQGRPPSALHDRAPASFAAQWTEPGAPSGTRSGPDGKAAAGNILEILT